MDNNYLLETKNLTLEINGKKILNDVQFSLNSGELVGLIGPNGAGKTTLLKQLAGLNVQNNAVYFKGKPIEQSSLSQRAKEVAYLAQGAPVHWPLTVERVVALGRIPHQSYWQKISSVDKKIIQQAMGQAEIEHLSQRTVTSLSGGERMRVLLARLFATDPQVILADEPTAALDPYHQIHVMELLKQRTLTGKSVVVVMHDLSLAARFCDRLVLLKEGCCLVDGSVTTVIRNEWLEKAYGITADIICNEEGVAIIPRREKSTL